MCFIFLAIATFLMPQSRDVVLFRGLVLVVLVVVGVSQVKVESDGTLSSTLSQPPFGPVRLFFLKECRECNGNSDSG